MHLLDINCGMGKRQEIGDDRVSRISWLSEFGGSHAYGIDGDAKKIEKAKIRVNNGTIFETMDINHTSFPDNFFQVIHMNEVMSNDDVVMLREIKRILSDYGVIIWKVSVNNFNFGRLLHWVLNKFDGEDVFTTDGYLNILREGGFRVTSKEYYWYFEILGITNLWFCKKVSKALKTAGLDRIFCRKLVITAIKELVGEEL